MAEVPTLTVEQYYARVRSYGLRQSPVAGIWLDRENQTRSVPNPEDLSPHNRWLVVEEMRRHFHLSSEH